VAAARKLADTVCAEGNGVPLLVVHDFDKYGFEISQRLTTVSDWAEENDRVVYRFQNAIDAIDLGLRLEDVEKYDIEGETCDFEGTFAPDSIATEEEQEYLRAGRRVELNQLTAPQFLEWLEGKLEEHLPERLIPDDKVLEDAYRRAVAIARLNRTLKEALGPAVEEAESAAVPEALRADLEEALGSPDEPGAWDTALYRLVAGELEAGDGE
jgi:hypothetical protein